MTRCLICGKGERAGSHDPKSGIAPKSKDFAEHKFVNNNLPDDENEFGFKDKFVSNKRRDEKL